MNDWPPPSVEDAPSVPPTAAGSTVWWRHPMTQALLVAWVVAGVIALVAIGFVRAVEPDAAMRPELTPATAGSAAADTEVTSTTVAATSGTSAGAAPTGDLATDGSSPTSTATTEPLVRSAPPVPTTIGAQGEATTTTVVVTLPTTITAAPPPTVRALPDIEVETNFDAIGDDDADPNGEWVRFTNVGDRTVDVTGWLVRDDGFEHAHVFASLSLDPGASVTVYSGCGEPTLTERYFCDGEVWNNDGDVVSLFDRTGVLIVQRRG